MKVCGVKLKLNFINLFIVNTAQLVMPLSRYMEDVIVLNAKNVEPNFAGFVDILLIIITLFFVSFTN